MSQLSLFERPRAPSFLTGLRKRDPDGLRYYQREAYDAFHSALDGGHKRPLIWMATGLGKTQTFGAVAKHWDGRVLVLAHREELVFQARDRLEQMSGEMVGVEKADLYSRKERMVVGSVQTVCKPKRLERLKQPGGFSLVITDEAHHYTAKSYRRPLEFFSDATVLGVTATPWRTDKSALGRIFDTVCYEKHLLDGIEDGFLAPMLGCQVDIQDIDLSKVSVKAGDFVKAQLDEEVLQGVEGIVMKTLELYPYRRGPIFFPGKASANVACARFNALQAGSAAVVTDDTPYDERRDIMRSVRKGDIRYLCNVMVATEGFDWPEASMVGLARPTKSLTVHTQMIGRGSRVTANVDSVSERHQVTERLERIAASTKPDCVVVDFVGNCGQHEPVSIVDIFRGSYTDAEVKKAKELSRESGEVDPLAILGRARKELKALAQAAKSVRSKVKAAVKHFDLFVATGIKRSASEAYTAKHGFTPATMKQLQYLEKCGVPVSTKISKNEASKAINAITTRRRKKLATVKQLKVLFRHGWEDRNITFDTASYLLNHCASKNWRGIDETQLKQALEKKHEQRTARGEDRKPPRSQISRQPAMRPEDQPWD